MKTLFHMLNTRAVPSTSDVTDLFDITTYCILSPLLFNIPIEEIIRETSDKWEGGIGIGRRAITNFRYADDTPLIQEK